MAVRLTEVWYFIPTAVYWSVPPGLVKAKRARREIFYERLQKYYNLMAPFGVHRLLIPVTFLANGLVLTLFGTAYAEAGLMLAVMIWANLFTFLVLARKRLFQRDELEQNLSCDAGARGRPECGPEPAADPALREASGRLLATCTSYWFAAHGAGLDKPWQIRLHVDQSDFLTQQWQDLPARRLGCTRGKHADQPHQRPGLIPGNGALLADEMGLGKTVQAIAACELLRRTRDIRRVLVISPASLKGEWEEQIGKFTELPSHIVQGPRAKRLQQYKKSAFFFLANYEQIRPDVEEINTTLMPDVIILDEAQRIKNWQTKTANSVKRLQSPYAFVLTGTPVENRIDEIYSITQFLDPLLLGPLFRFNRDFYQLDEKGRAIGYKNLDRLHERLQPILLRRRKEDVEGELPGRTVNTYFVPMHKEQALRYEEYEAKVARLATMARKRPLRKEEMERLQQYLACMRMLCDTPYILDPDCRISPKLKELGNILQELMEDGDHKIIIFSEWERMLQLVRVQADEMRLGHAWHTGKVPQPQRRAEIRRFKNDPDCRLFLSTDSGSVGLNLQVADVVINLDMPWNPAKLEQRIARAWRKHQKKSVQVINLVSEHSIEHRMLSLLEQKRALAEGVVDGKGKNEMALPSGRAAFLERLDALMPGDEKGPSMSASDSHDRLRDEILSRWIHQLERMELHGEGERRTLLVVADPINDALQSALTDQLKALFPKQTPQLQLLDPDAFATIQQLIDAGVLSANQENARTLYQTTDKPKDHEPQKRLAEAREHLARGEHQRRMAKVLIGGGFSVEAIPPIRDAVEAALRALVVWQGHNSETPPEPDLIDSVLVKTSLVPVETLSLITHLRENQSEWDESQGAALLAQSDRLLSQAASLLESSKNF